MSFSEADWYNGEARRERGVPCAVAPTRCRGYAAAVGNGWRCRRRREARWSERAPQAQTGGDSLPGWRGAGGGRAPCWPERKRRPAGKQSVPCAIAPSMVSWGGKAPPAPPEVAREGLNSSMEIYGERPRVGRCRYVGPAPGAASEPTRMRRARARNHPACRSRARRDPGAHADAPGAREAGGTGGLHYLTTTDLGGEDTEHVPELNNKTYFVSIRPGAEPSGRIKQNTCFVIILPDIGRKSTRQGKVKMRKTDKDKHDGQTQGAANCGQQEAPGPGTGCTTEPRPARPINPRR